MLPSDSSTIVTVRQVSGESTQVSGPITMWAQPIQIQLQATDSSLFTTATSTSTSASGAPSSSSSSGLSQGASIGIGVGVGVGGALIIAALAFWFFRRRKTKKNMDPSYQRAGHPEASELGRSSQQTAPESVGTHTRSTNPSELAADQGPKPVHELYG